MPVSLHWLLNDRIIYSHFSGIVTLSELRLAVSEGVELVDSVNPLIPLIHGIVDNRDVTEFPKSSLKLSRSLNDLLRHQRLGWILYVSDMNPTIKMLSSLVSQIARKQYHSVGTMQEAIEFLQHIDTTLPQLSIENWSTLPIIREIIIPD